MTSFEVLTCLRTGEVSLDTMIILAARWIYRSTAAKKSFTLRQGSNFLNSVKAVCRAVGLAKPPAHRYPASMSMESPYSWTAFPGECLIYLSIMVMVHLALFVVGCLALCGVALWNRGTFVNRARRLGLFLGLLLAVGSISNGFWSCLIWRRLYYSTDYTFDFSPFWPITQGVIDAPFGEMRGQLFGVSLFQLQLIWLLFALGTWAASIALYRFISRRSPRFGG